MSIADLERQGLIHKHRASPEDVQQTLRRARDELAAARLLAEPHPASAYELAYNAMLFAISALMYAAGYRAAAERHHATLVDFAEDRLGLFHLPLVNEFDTARRKRHRTVYEQKPVSRKEALHAVDIAEKLIAVVEKQVNAS